MLLACYKIDSFASDGYSEKIEDIGASSLAMVSLSGGNQSTDPRRIVVPCLAFFWIAGVVQAPLGFRRTLLNRKKWMDCVAFKLQVPSEVLSDIPSCRA